MIVFTKSFRRILSAFICLTFLFTTIIPPNIFAQQIPVSGLPVPSWLF